MSNKNANPPVDQQRRRVLTGLAAASASGLIGCGTSSAPAASPAPALPSPENSGIDHIVVVMMENRSFDHVLGWVPGANGLQAGLSYPDASGIPQPTHHLTPDYQGCGLEDPPHGYDHGRICVAGGAMNGFLGESAVGDTFPIGYYTAADLSFFAGCAQEWTICDRYHSGILASTQPNRMYMHCGQTDRLTTGSGLPMTSTLPTIWDTTAEAGVSAGYYFSNLPYTAIWEAKYLSITRSVAAFFRDAAAGTLPSISYVDPFFYESGLGELANDDHPFADVRNGQRFLNRIYSALRTSPNWPRTLLVINYDEWGGFFDHVIPPFMPVSDEERDTVGNDGQLGIRVPCILIGPRARRGHIEQTLFEPNSILKFMEWRWGLRPLGVRAAVTNNLLNALDFSSASRTDQPEFRIPANDTRSAGCALGPDNRMTASMAEHAQEVSALQQKARDAGFVW